MKEKKKTLLRAFYCCCCLAWLLPAGAQVSLTGQLRTRTEFRDGTGTLLPKNSDPSFFISQRTRLTFNYQTGRVIFQTSLQDVRVWGQDASTISSADGARLSVHEAWAAIVLANKSDSTFTSRSVDYFAVKIGRQELLYDDSRLLGNLDWLQQGRRHDAIVFKLLNKGWQFDIGNAFNQNTDAFNYNGTYYTPANTPAYVKDSRGNLAPTPAGLIPLTNTAGWSLKSGLPSLQTAPSTNSANQDYKALQYAYAVKTVGATKISALVVADHFGRYRLDSVKNISGVDTGYIYGRKFDQKGVNSRFTGGILVNSLLNTKKTLLLAAGFYYQAGKDRDASRLSAYTGTITLTYNRNKFSYSAGWDYLSGNDAFSASAVNHRFDPLYGTPHKFWGYMDYFYAGTGAPAGGLSNPYLKVKYSSSGKRFSAGVDYHYFGLAGSQRDNNGLAVSKYLGIEFDLLANYALNAFTGIEWGGSLMAASGSMAYAKGIAPGTARLTGAWTYLSVNIRPDFLLKGR